MWTQKALLTVSIIIINIKLTSGTCKATCSVINQKERIVKCSGRQLTCIPIVHPQTKELVLENNLLTKLTRNSFTHLPNLEKLSLTNNHIMSIEPGAFNDLQHLEALYLRKNKLGKISSGVLAGMPKLKVLDLAHNNIVQIDSNAMTPIKSLVHLYLSANKLRTISDNMLSGLQNVQLISFLSNNISLISDNAFNGLPRLQTIYLGNNKLTTIPNILKHARSLVSIGLENNPLTCDCQLEYLRNWLRTRMTSRRILTSSPVRCASPALLKGEDLRTITFRLKCVKPNITTTDTNILAKIKNNVIIKCEVTGSPMPSILWSIPPQVSHSQVKHLPDGRLLINSAQTSHTGEYICIAKSIAGEVKKYFKLEVLCDCNSCSQHKYPLPEIANPNSNIVVGQDGDRNVDPCATDYSMVHVSLAGVFITIAITFVLTFLVTSVFLTYWFRRQSRPVRKHTDLNNTSSCSSSRSSSTSSSSERRLLPIPQEKNGMGFPCIARYYTPPERPKTSTDHRSKNRHRKLVASISDNTYSSMYSSMCMGNDEYTYVHNGVNDDSDYDYRNLGHIYAGPNEVLRNAGTWNTLPMYMNREDGRSRADGRYADSSNWSCSGTGGVRSNLCLREVSNRNGIVCGYNGPANRVGRNCIVGPTETNAYDCLDASPDHTDRTYNQLNKL